MFIIIDGIDGSGKSTILNSWKNWFLKQEFPVFDLREWWEKYKTFPEFDKIKKAKVIISAEPTQAWLGSAIREEIVRDGREYGGLSIAQAFALDREILYRRLLIPALKAKKIVLQERGVTTTLVYQPIQKKKVALKDILSLPGNQLTLKYRPDFLVIAKIFPQKAIERLRKRFHKQDGSIFENLAFEIKAQKRFLSLWFKRFFEKRGTYVLYFNTDDTENRVQEEAVRLLKNCLQFKI